MGQSTEDYLDSLLRQAMGIPEPIKEEPVEEQNIEESGLEDVALSMNGDAAVNVDEPELEGTNFSSDKVNRFFADDAPFSDDFVYPEEALLPDEGVEIPEEMKLTNEGRILLGEEPIIEETEPVSEEPVVDSESVEDSELNELMPEELMAGDLFSDEQMQSGLIGEEPVAEEPLMEESIADETVNEETVSDDSMDLQSMLDGLSMPETDEDSVSEDVPQGDNLAGDDSLFDNSDIADLLNSIDNFENMDNASESSPELEVGGYDLGEVDLGAMLDDVTGSLESEGDLFSVNADEMGAEDLNALLNSIDGDDDISDIGELLSKDENSEMVDPSSMEALFGSDSESFIDIDGALGENPEEEESPKKKKKKEKKKKKDKKKSKKDSFDGFESDEEIALDPDSFDFSAKGSEGGSDKFESKKGFWAKLFDKLFEEEGEDEESDESKLIEETAMDIAVEGAAVNEEILKEAEETGKDKKKKKEKKKDKKKKDKAASSEDGEEGQEQDTKKRKKKEKKKKEDVPEIPEKKLPKKKVAAILILVISIGAIIGFAAFFAPYSSDMVKAKKYYSVGDYNKTYEYLSGHKLSDDEQILYEKAFILSKVDRFYNSYLNYVKMDMKMEALNSLVQGIKAVDEMAGRAGELGIFDKMMARAQFIIDELNNAYGLSVDVVREWTMIDNPQDYTRKIYDFLDSRRPRDEEGNLVALPDESELTILSEEEDL